MNMKSKKWNYIEIMKIVAMTVILNEQIKQIIVSISLSCFIVEYWK